IAGRAEHAHGMVMRQHDVFHRLVGDATDARKDVLRHHGRRLRVGNQHCVVADDDAGIRIAFGGVGVCVIGQAVEAHRLLREIGLGGECLAHGNSSLLRTTDCGIRYYATARNPHSNEGRLRAMPENLIVETRERVGVLRINRPQRMNALNDALAREICEALFANDADPAIGCNVIVGSEKAFAAGADIGAMAEWDYAKVYADDYITKDWEGIRRVRKPVIAAVAGYALGGGCELAMACDIIIAADTARFGQPEITIGTMPGFGGTQRLPRAVGKAKAMEWCLTGRMIAAGEAERAGLVARVVAAADLEREAIA